MGKRKSKEIKFPLKGIDRSRALRQQPPYSAYDAHNVFPLDTIEGRARGGSRPGMVCPYVSSLTNRINMLESMNLALGDNFVVDGDNFESGSEMSTRWSEVSWIGPLASVTSSSLIGISYENDSGGGLFEELTIDKSKPFVSEIFIVPAGIHCGNYTLYSCIDSNGASVEHSGIEVTASFATDESGNKEIRMKWWHGDTLAGDVVLDSTSDEMPLAGWLSLVKDGDYASVYWNGLQMGATQNVGSFAGTRSGLKMECLIEGGICLVNAFRQQFYSESELGGTRTIIVGASGGVVFRENLIGHIGQVASDYTVDHIELLQGVQTGQDLFIADYGHVPSSGDCHIDGLNLTDSNVSDWTALGINSKDYAVELYNPLGGTNAGVYQIDIIFESHLQLVSSPGNGDAKYTVQRCPKVYSPATDELESVVAEEGFAPVGCQCVARFLDRIVLGGGGASPHVWYMSRVGNYLDWDYSQMDPQRAVAGTASEAGVPGAPITALIPHYDDYLIIGCRNQLWRMRGDPAYGGILHAISHTVGVVSKTAWTFGANNEVLFLSPDGLYALSPSGESVPERVSKNKLPREMINVDSNNVMPFLEYDNEMNGIHIFLTPRGSSITSHWWFDMNTGSFWKVLIDDTREPVQTTMKESNMIEDYGVVLACRDSKLRQFSSLSPNDNGISFVSDIIIGPISLTDNDFLDGVLREIRLVIARTSRNVRMQLAGIKEWQDIEDIDFGSVSSVIIPHYSPTRRQCVRGRGILIKLSSDDKWALESAIITVEQTAGRSVNYG